MTRIVLRGLILLASVAMTATAVRADETVQLGEQANSAGVLIRPSGTPVGSIILMTGGSGILNVGPGGSFTAGLGNQLIRTRKAYVDAGFAVLLVDRFADLTRAVKTMAAIKRPVTVVGTSRGTQRAARGIAAGARPDKLVLTSGFLTDASGDPDNVRAILGSPAALPQTLVVHHRQDGCAKTQPAGVDPFKAWGGNKVRVVWLTGGANVGDPCEARGHHGFAGIDAKVVSEVVEFAKR